MSRSLSFSFISLFLSLIATNIIQGATIVSQAPQDGEASYGAYQRYQTVDEFRLSCNVEIVGLRWWGGYGPLQPPDQDNVIVRFYKVKASGSPEIDPFLEYHLTNTKRVPTSMTSSPGQPVFEYQVIFPEPLQFQESALYFVGILPIIFPDGGPIGWQGSKLQTGGYWSRTCPYGECDSADSLPWNKTEGQTDLAFELISNCPAEEALTNSLTINAGVEDGRCHDGTIKSGLAVTAIFTPRCGCTLKEVASAFGYHHFNWFNMVTEDTAGEESETDEGLKQKIIDNRLYNRFMEIPQAPFEDPPIGGWAYMAGYPKYDCMLCPQSEQLADKSYFITGDHLPWYYEESDFYCPDLEWNKNDFYMPEEADLDDKTTMIFFDAPGTFDCHKKVFKTSLVGVFPGSGNGEILTLKRGAPDLTFEWAIGFLNNNCYEEPDIVNLGFIGPYDFTDTELSLFNRLFIGSTPAKRSDLDRDGQINGSDLSFWAVGFGQTSCGAICPMDFDEDGDIDGNDLSFFISEFDI